MGCCVAGSHIPPPPVILMDRVVGNRSIACSVLVDEPPCEINTTMGRSPAAAGCVKRVPRIRPHPTLSPYILRRHAPHSAKCRCRSDTVYPGSPHKTASQILLSVIFFAQGSAGAPRLAFPVMIHTVPHEIISPFQSLPAAAHPFRPDVAMPSTIYFWNKRYTATGGMPLSSIAAILRGLQSRNHPPEDRPPKR